MTKIIITIVLGLVAATAVGFWYFSNLNTDLQGENTANQLVSNETPLATNNPDQLKGKDSIMSLMALGKSMECTFMFSGEGMRGEGTGFFDNGYARVDSLYSGSGTESVSSYMIMDDKSKTMYSWFTNDGVTQGMKMSTAAPSSASVPKQANMDSSKTQVAPDSAVQYDCKPWVADGSVFVPPSDVEFTDMTEMQKMMEGMPKNMEGMTMPNMP